jgi:hypothetical protein
MSENAYTPETRQQKRFNERQSETILKMARSRLNTAIGALSDSRNSQLEDLRFSAGSSDNNWQWPESAISTRLDTNGVMARPTLTINKLPQHIKQVTNDQRQNRPAGKVIPVDSGADVEIAEILDGMVRHVEYISDADVAYDTACEAAVTHGEGFWRIRTDYLDEMSFDQDILIERILNPFSVYLDPMILKPCGDDARWGFIVEDITHEEFEEQYPDAAPVGSIERGTGDGGLNQWINEKTVRIAEYFYVEAKRETLNLYSNGATAFEGTPEDKALRVQVGEPIKSRKSERKKICWVKTNGYEILEEGEWAGKYIPIIRVVGNEFLVDGERFVTGLVRNAKDAQRMYNYWVSQEAEMLALAPKAPFIGYAGQFEGFEKKWNTANTTPWPFLEVNPDVTDGNGTALPLPQRAMPPMAQQGQIAAKQGSAEDIKATTGQYNASLGMTSNERSGKAILARQHEGDVGTYHYGDNLARAVRYSTRQIVDLIPKIYDTARVARIIGEDGETKMVQIDPDQPMPVREEKNEQGIVIAKIYNPSVGRYDVRVATGPGYATKRQQALDAMVELLQGNPELWALAGDLFVKNMDWPGAQELAKRLKKAVDPKLLEDNDNPALQQAKMQLEQLAAQFNHAQQMLQNVQHSMEAKELDIKAFEAQIKAYEAQTKRIQVTQDGLNPDKVQDIAMATIDAAIENGHLIGSIPQAPMPEQPVMPQEVPPMDPGAPAPAQQEMM